MHGRQPQTMTNAKVYKLPYGGNALIIIIHGSRLLKRLMCFVSGLLKIQADNYCIQTESLFFRV